MANLGFLGPFGCSAVRTVEGGILKASALQPESPEPREVVRGALEPSVIDNI